MATRCFSLLLATVALTVVLTLQAEADEQKTVNATVTALLISINVSPTSVDYGTQAVGATNVAPSPAFFSVTNTGNVNEKFAIKGADTANWSLAGGGQEPTPTSIAIQHPAAQGRSWHSPPRTKPCSRASRPWGSLTSF